MRPVARPRTPSVQAAMASFAAALNGRDKRFDELTDAELDQWRHLSQRRALRMRADQDRRLTRRDEAYAIAIVVTVGLLAMFPLLWAGIR